MGSLDDYSGSQKSKEKVLYLGSGKEFQKSAL